MSFPKEPKDRPQTRSWGDFAFHAGPASGPRFTPARCHVPERRKSHRRGDAVEADSDATGFQRAVILLDGAEDDDLGARLQFALVG